MLRNYFKIALRNLWKHRGYAFINVAGLAVGMACCLMIVLFIQDELRYDRYHEKADAIYRVTLDLKMPGAEFELASTMTPLGPALLADMPEVVQYARVTRPRERLIASQNKRFYEDAFYFADSTLFDVFTYPFVYGNPQTALRKPYSVVLTQETARKYFGDENPVGKVLRMDEAQDFEVTGVLASLPRYTHFKFDFLASFDSQPSTKRQEAASWTNVSDVHTYVVIPDQAAAVERKLPGFLEKYLDEEEQQAIGLHLQSLSDIHLHSDLANEDGDTGSATTIYVFASIALLILLIAAINFINLATARAEKRAREVGVRKVLGAFRGQLIRQFLGESLLLAGLALLLSLILVEALLPLFNGLLQKELAARYMDNGMLLLALGSITLFVGIVAGSYPAFVLSAFRPVEVLKGQARQGWAGVLFRKGLVVVQFAIAIMLIIGSVVMAAQMTYFSEKDLGFESNQVVVVPMRDASLQARYETLKRALVQHPGVLNAAAASFTPGENSYSLGSYLPEGKDEGQEIGFRTIFIDADMVPTLGLRLVAGRNFSSDVSTDTTAALLVNEATVRSLGWDDPLGKTLTTDEQPMEVVGVLKDFHYSSLQEEIQPIVFRFSPDVLQSLVVRIRAEQVAETLAF
ncbi:MAG TPA: ABC transporter permease, partial [Rhodothermales bacterium]|nr:ABC transporter permease [Rhodothermales bacterium]